MAFISHTIHVDDEDSPERLEAFSFVSDGARLGYVNVAEGSRVIGTPKGLEALAEALMEAASKARTDGIQIGVTIASLAREGTDA